MIFYIYYPMSNVLGLTLVFKKDNSSARERIPSALIVHIDDRSKSIAPVISFIQSSFNRMN